MKNLTIKSLQKCAENPNDKNLFKLVLELQGGRHAKLVIKKGDQLNRVVNNFVINNKLTQKAGEKLLKLVESTYNEVNYKPNKVLQASFLNK